MCGLPPSNENQPAEAQIEDLVLKGMYITMYMVLMASLPMTCVCLCMMCDVHVSLIQPLKPASAAIFKQRSVEM